MTAGVLLPAGVSKEIRALFPIWAACTLSVAAVAITGDYRVFAAATVAYGLGSIALGAQSIGHEYTHRTLALLLSHPSDRRRLFVTKFGVLTAMLLVLTAVAWIFLFSNARFAPRSIEAQPRILYLAGLWGLFVAPWLTMVCRSTMAGMVFTIVAPLLLLIAGDLIGVAKYGIGGGIAIDRFKFSLLWWGSFAVCAVAAVSSWRVFMRLEAIDGGGAQIHIPDWLHSRDESTADSPDSATLRRRHPVRLLVKKELRLQQLTFVIAGVYVAVWATVSLLERFWPSFPELPLGPISVGYFALLAVLIGSLASAEERQLGTLEWQLLLPMARRKQFAVKAAVALGLALVLGLGLPALLGYLTPSESELRATAYPARAIPTIAVAIVLLTTGSLYISSLCGSGVRAMVLCLPVAVGTLWFVNIIGGMAFELVGRLVDTLGIWPSRYGVESASAKSLMFWLPKGLILPFSAVLLGFSLLNHQTSDRSRGRLVWQAMWLVSFITLGVLLLTVVEVLSRIR